MFSRLVYYDFVILYQMRIVILLSVISTISCSKLVNEIVSFFQTVLQAQGKTSFDVEAYELLAAMFDEDARCNQACQNHLKEWLEEGIPFTRLNEIVDQVSYYLGQPNDQLDRR